MFEISARKLAQKMPRFKVLCCKENLKLYSLSYKPQQKRSVSSEQIVDLKRKVNNTLTRFLSLYIYHFSNVVDFSSEFLSSIEFGKKYNRHWLFTDFLNTVQVQERSLQISLSRWFQVLRIIAKFPGLFYWSVLMHKTVSKFNIHNYFRHKNIHSNFLSSFHCETAAYLAFKQALVSKQPTF